MFSYMSSVSKGGTDLMLPKSTTFNLTVKVVTVTYNFLCMKKTLKVHSCKLENFPLCSNLCKNNALKILPF